MRDVTPRSRSRPRLPAEMRRSQATTRPRPRDASSNDDDEDDDVSSDVSEGSAVRRRHEKHGKDKNDDVIRSRARTRMMTSCEAEQGQER